MKVISSGDTVKVSIEAVFVEGGGCAECCMCVDNFCIAWDSDTDSCKVPCGCHGNRDDGKDGNFKEATA